MNAADFEGQRRNIARWLSSDVGSAVNPSPASKRSAAGALGLDFGAFEDDEDSELPLSRSEASQLYSLLGKAIGVRS